MNFFFEFNELKIGSGGESSPSAHNLISKTCPEFQVLSTQCQLLTFVRLMGCSMSIERKLREVKLFQLPSLSNAITYIDRTSAVKNSGISFLTLIFNLSNPITTILHAKKLVSRLQDFVHEGPGEQMPICN